MNKSKRRCGFLLILWAFFTANLSQKVELFPKGSQLQKDTKMEMGTHVLDSLHIPQEIHVLPASAQQYTAIDAN